MPEEESATGLVTAFHPNDENAKNLKDWSIISLKHPASGDTLEFVLLRTKSGQPHIYEVQGLEINYGSYFVGSHVLSNGALHVATRIDPLFFALAKLVSGGKWQPFEQLEIPETIQKCIADKKQYQHVCQVNDQLGGDMLLYKLNDEKVLKWLTKKQERAYAVMKEDLLNSTDQGPATSAMSHGFNLVEEDDAQPQMTSTPTAASLSNTDQLRIRQHSIQVVCEYLNPEWCAKWLEHLGENETGILKTEEERKPAKRTWEVANVLDDTMNLVSVEKQKPISQSAGLKRLQKVSKKGMKSMSSFFGAKKK
jgi:ribonuclease H2 subunit B